MISAARHTFLDINRKHTAVTERSCIVEVLFEILDKVRLRLGEGLRAPAYYDQ